VTKHLRQNYQLYLLVLPTLAYFTVFSLYPIVQGFLTSLQEPRLLGGGTFVGLENYHTVLNDRAFWQALRNTLVMGTGMVALGVVVPLFIAILLYELPFKPLQQLAQNIAYTPHLFSWIVVGGIWIQVLSPSGGLVNSVLSGLGLEPVHFLARPDLAKPVLVLLAVWKDMGYNAIIYFAALSALDPTLFEAAKIDGANRWAKHRFITLPLLRPTALVVLVLSVVGTLRMFDQIFVLRNPATARSLDVLMTYVYDRGIAGFQLGLAAAASFLVVAVGLVLLLGLRNTLKISKEELY
jgi:putative aldouronate transport system permease protein